MKSFSSAEVTICYWLLLNLTCLVGLEARRNRPQLEGSVSRKDECGLNEELRVCRPSCEPTCIKRNPSCSTTCGPAICRCKQGFARQFELCVSLSACRFFTAEIMGDKKKVKSKRMLLKPHLDVSAKISPTLPIPESTTNLQSSIRHPSLSRSQKKQQHLKNFICNGTCTKTKKSKAKKLHYSIGRAVDVLRSRKQAMMAKLLRHKVITIKPKSVEAVSAKQIISPVLKIVPKYEIQKVFKANRTSKIEGRGPKPPISTYPLGESKSKKAEKINKGAVSSMSSNEPIPPTPLPPSEHQTHGAPAARPLRFEPPGITPLIYFRKSRIERKQEMLRQLKLHLKRFRAI
ncbi:trypsin Inhibitor like cysteine rich domain protein [Dictyocaulus viviparus]|uniref:Trypsin Inhibitor like cysteine rich domain protein n=1 Tax=Dictyocaulus viviparus TaxID=29172 RepID=A0A0D8Y0G1_DICVI|nr:trypsin Inhibitor like cysteine rich domain protein [Dictyocaulus viviparus]